MPCKFLLVLGARLEAGCRRFTLSGQYLSSNRSTSVTKKVIKNSTGTIITSCSYTRISEGADHMLARNTSETFEISSYKFGDSSFMFMIPLFFLTDMVYSPQNTSPVLHSEYAELEVAAILCRDRMWI